VPTQFLMEYGYPLLPMNKFNGTLVDSNRTDISVWRMLYASYLTSYVGATASTLPSLTAVNTSINTVETTGTIPISLLHLNYNDLRPDAVTAGLMTVANEQIFDVAGRTQSPYRSQTLFAAAPSLNYSYDATTKFVFPANLLIKNTGTINAIAVDFADGLGYRAVTLGTTMYISYAVIGTYRVKVKITPTTGAVLESWFDFEVNTASCTGCLYAIGREQTLSDPTFLASTANGHSGGNITFIKSMNNTTNRIIKPLIVLKGFDIFSSAPHIAKKRYQMVNLIAGINNSNSDGYNFNSKLDDIAQYDIVLIDYENGTDDIKRNARLLQAVIRKINSQKQVGDPDNVVMGMSMGGLIARFGLAQMVLNGENTQTRLVITHDSPHRGANVPLGFQYMGRQLVNIGFNVNISTVPFFPIFLKDIFPQFKELNDLLSAPAAVQQIMLRATGTTPASVVANAFLADGGEYRTMVDRITPYKVIATSNGSQCATSLFPPNSILIKGDAGGFVAVVPWVFESGIRTAVQINSANNFAVSEVVNWRVYSQTKILGIPINNTISRFTANSPAIKPFDGASGGTIPIVNHQSKSSYWWTPFVGYSLKYTGQDDFCFVPTGSALDATNFSTISLTETYVNGVNTTNPSKFTSFIAQNQFQKTIYLSNAIPIPSIVTAFNSRHITFYGRTSHWLFDQMENITPSSNQECTTECGSFTSAAITGNSPFCTTSSFSVNTPTSIPVAWSLSPLGIATLSANGNTVTLTRIVDGNITLTAKLGSGSCITVIKSVQVGIAPPAFTVSEVQKPCPPTTNNGDYIINPATAGVTYAWQCSGCDALNVIPTQGASAGIIVNNSGSYTFSVLATTNGCSTSTSSIDKTFSTGTNCGILRIGISPNPVKTQLSLSVEDADDAEGKNGYQVTIADYLGNVKYDAKLSSINAQIDVATLSSGTYSMRIIKGPKIVTKTFSVVK
jgi:Secretion system C-terminal sorting domain